MSPSSVAFWIFRSRASTRGTWPSRIRFRSGPSSSTRVDVVPRVNSKTTSGRNVTIETKSPRALVNFLSTLFLNAPMSASVGGASRPLASTR